MEDEIRKLLIMWEHGFECGFKPSVDKLHESVMEIINIRINEIKEKTSFRLVYPTEVTHDNTHES